MLTLAEFRTLATNTAAHAQQLEAFAEGHAELGPFEPEEWLLRFFAWARLSRTMVYTRLPVVENPNTSNRIGVNIPIKLTEFKGERPDPALDPDFAGLAWHDYRRKWAEIYAERVRYNQRHQLDPNGDLGPTNPKFHAWAVAEYKREGQMIYNKQAITTWLQQKWVEYQQKEGFI